MDVQSQLLVHRVDATQKHTVVIASLVAQHPADGSTILAEGAIALSVTLSGGALFAD